MVLKYASLWFVVLLHHHTIINILYFYESLIGEIQFLHSIVLGHYTQRPRTHAHTRTHRTLQTCISWRDVRVTELLHSWCSKQLGGLCLAQGHFSSTQEVNWHLSSYQSTLHTVVHAGLQPATLYCPVEVNRICFCCCSRWSLWIFLGNNTVFEKTPSLFFILFLKLWESQMFFFHNTAFTPS